MIPFIFKYWKQLLFFLVVIALIIEGNLHYNAVRDKARAEENIRQLQFVNSTLTLTPKELDERLRKSEQRSDRHLDSLFKANKINPKGVQEAHNIVNNYYKKDSTTIIIPATSTLTPISVGDVCWGFSGFINNQKLEIKERYFHAEIDLVDYAKPRKFLFIRIGWHPPELKAFSDCGTVTVKSYKRARDSPN